ncbi:MAG: hypothetical protein EBT20_11355 [Alphaproteobacteria bacterium]|nr:hypothetical protein [Alphaproteobacteria bacterium]
MVDQFQQRSAAAQAAMSRQQIREFRIQVARVRSFAQLLDEETQLSCAAFGEIWADDVIMHGLQEDFVSKAHQLLMEHNALISVSRLHELWGQSLMIARNTELGEPT